MDRPPANKTEQTQQYILNYIQERHLVHNDWLPPENDLCRTLNVSRVTVRAALKELEEKGLVYQRRGSGTFVGEHSLPQRAELTYVPYVAPLVLEVFSADGDPFRHRGLPQKPRDVRHLPLDRLADEALDRVLQTAAPDAFFCCNDASALLLCGLLRVRGYRIPEDIGIVGVDALPMTENHDPPITTFDQPFFDMGRRAAQLCCAHGGSPEGVRADLYAHRPARARIDAPAPYGAGGRARRIKTGTGACGG